MIWTTSAASSRAFLFAQLIETQLEHVSNLSADCPFDCPRSLCGHPVAPSDENLSSNSPFVVSACNLHSPCCVMAVRIDDSYFRRRTSTP